MNLVQTSKVKFCLKLLLSMSKGIFLAIGVQCLKNLNVRAFGPPIMYSRSAWHLLWTSITARLLNLASSFSCTGFSILNCLFFLHYYFCFKTITLLSKITFLYFWSSSKFGSIDELLYSLAMCISFFKMSILEFKVYMCALKFWLFDGSERWNSWSSFSD